MKRIIALILTTITAASIMVGTAFATDTMTDEELRSRNIETIIELHDAMMTDEASFYADDAVRSLPFFPPDGAYWKGIDDIRKNAELNMERFGTFEYGYLQIHSCVDPNVFWIEAGGATEDADLSKDATDIDAAGSTYETNYVLYVEFNDEGRVIDYREYMNPMNLFPALGIETPEMALPEYAVGRKEIYGDNDPHYAEHTVLIADDIENAEGIRNRNIETIKELHSAMMTDEASFYADDAVRSLPFFPPDGAYWKGIDDIRKNAELNQERFGNFEYSYLNIHSCLDPNIFWIEAGGSTEEANLSANANDAEAAGNTYETHYVLYVEFNDDGKVIDYREYMSPINLFPALGIEIPEMALPDYAVGREAVYGTESAK